VSGPVPDLGPIYVVSIVRRDTSGRVFARRADQFDAVGLTLPLIVLMALHHAWQQGTGIEIRKVASK
jgi:hypothetical protein